MYPLSISVDEHVPLNMGAERIFFQRGANSGFTKGGPKMFLQGEPKVVEAHFHHLKLQKQSLLQNI